VHPIGSYCTDKFYTSHLVSWR